MSHVEHRRGSYAEMGLERGSSADCVRELERSQRTGQFTPTIEGRRGSASWINGRKVSLAGWVREADGNEEQ